MQNAKYKAKCKMIAWIWMKFRSKSDDFDFRYFILILDFCILISLNRTIFMAMKIGIGKICALALLICGHLFADDCYMDRKMWLVVRVGKKGKVFETMRQWLADGNNRNMLADSDTRWFARSADGILTDAALLDTAGQTDLAQKLALERASAKRRSTLQLIIGLPLGLGMIGGSAYWGSKTWDKETPSTIDLAGAIVLGTAGLGVVIGVISSYIHHHSAPEPNEHQIALTQAADIVDRYNEAIYRKCHSGSSAESPSGR